MPLADIMLYNHVIGAFPQDGADPEPTLAPIGSLGKLEPLVVIGERPTARLVSAPSRAGIALTVER